MCYADCCGACMLADLHIATISDRERAAHEWSSVVCTLCTLGIIGSVMQSMWQNGKSPDGGADWILFAISTVGDIIGIISVVYATVIFGKAATAIAKAQGLEYEPAECMTNCCSDDMCCGGCCSLVCCCTYCCCGDCHFIQVARSFEGSQELVSNVEEGRPEKCRCCNCWVQPGVDTVSTAAGTQAV